VKIGHALLCILSVGLVASTACAPQARSTEPAGAGVAPDQPRAPKILTIGVQREHTPFVLSPGGSGPGGSVVGRGIAHGELVVQTDGGNYQPQLAVEQLSVERGTWVINPDGSMDTTWRIYPNIKWHDGTPFTTADLVFSAKVQSDKNIPTRREPGVELMQSVTALDPHTLRIHWSATFVDADRAAGMTPMARHLLEESYLSNPEDLPNHPYFTTQFVGVGPYRMVKWELGSHAEYARFDDYFQGRPPFDKVIVRFLGDKNTMIANILAGEVDLLVSTGVDLGAAAEIKRRWEGTGNQVRSDFTGGIEQFSLQHRLDYARPVNGIPNRLVRQALMYALDRQAMTDVMTDGLAPVAESWFRPGQAIWPEVEAIFARYPYNTGRAQQLLTEAGWVRGPDGVLVGSNGERFEQSIWSQVSTMGGDRLINIVADYWKAVGVQPLLEIIPIGRQGDREFEGTLPGPRVSGANAENLYINRLNTRYIAGPANRWAEKNVGGYSNPRFDVLSDRLQTAIDPKERTAIHIELLKEGMTEVPNMLFYWQVVPTIMLKGLKTHSIAPNLETWDFFYWDKE